MKKGRYGADIDEACRSLVAGASYIILAKQDDLNHDPEKEGKRCAYLPPTGEEAKMLDMRDHILVGVEFLCQSQIMLRGDPVSSKRHRRPRNSWAPNLYLPLLRDSQGN